MSEHTLSNLDYGYNYDNETWDIYPHGGDVIATFATEELAALFSSAPEMAAEIERLTAERDDERDDTIAGLRTAGAVIERLKEQNAALLESIQHAMAAIEANTVDEPPDYYRRFCIVTSYARGEWGQDE